MHIHIHVKPIYKDTMVFGGLSQKEFDDQKMKRFRKN